MYYEVYVEDKPEPWLQIIGTNLELAIPAASFQFGEYVAQLKLMYPASTVDGEETQPADF